MEPTMKTAEAISLFGKKAELARALGISRAAVSGWGDEVPPLRAYQIRALVAEGDPNRAHVEGRAGT
jgi:DNA-binding transcriptional regulator YdaS (Cro superfamily)